MANAPDGINPESLRGKVYLLILDKIVLGALIALAFIVYDQWKTTDQRNYDAHVTFDQRNYDDHVTFAFQRANYVKELVPKVVDPKQDLLVRSQALIALIETKSIGDSSALYFAEQLLEAGLLRVGYPKAVAWNQKNPLLDALQTRMPNGLQALLDQYITSEGSLYASKVDNPDRTAVREFWADLFAQAIDAHSDKELSVPNSAPFLLANLSVMESVFDKVGGERHILAKRWFARTSESARLVAALRDVGDVEVDQHKAALAYLATVINQDDSSGARADLAHMIIDMLQQMGWQSRSIASTCTAIMLGGDKSSSRGNRNAACNTYLNWYADQNRDALYTYYNVEGGGNGWLELQRILVAQFPNYWATRAANDAKERGPGVSNADQLLSMLVDGAGAAKGKRLEPAIRSILGDVLSTHDPSKKKLFSGLLLAKWKHLADAKH